MKNKLIIGLISIMCLAGIKEVNAHSYAEPGETLYEDMKSSYDSFKTLLPTVTTSSTSEETITLYGRSICSINPSTCEYNYAGYTVNAKVEGFEMPKFSKVEVIKDMVSCENDEKYIIYRFMGSGNEAYVEDNRAGYDSGENEEPVYWSEDYLVQCSNNGESTYGEVIDNSANSGNSGSSSSGNDYNSSTTVPTEPTGVETYYIILGLVGIIAYGFMTLIKKRNLFKNI